MEALFSVYDWRDMTRACGTIAAGYHEYPELEYVRLELKWNKCTAYGADGYHAVKVTRDCRMTDTIMPYTVFLMSTKIPAGTKTVILATNDADDAPGEAIKLTYKGKDNNVITVEEQPVPPANVTGSTFSIEAFFQRTIDNLRDERYTIAVNPKYLIDALSSMSDHEKVILHFGTMVQPFMILPAEDNPGEEAIVLPVRI